MRGRWQRPPTGWTLLYAHRFAPNRWRYACPEDRTRELWTWGTRRGQQVCSEQLLFPAGPASWLNCEFRFLATLMLCGVLRFVSKVMQPCGGACHESGTWKSSAARQATFRNTRIARQRLGSPKAGIDASEATAQTRPLLICRRKSAHLASASRSFAPHFGRWRGPSDPHWIRSQLRNYGWAFSAQDSVGRGHGLAERKGRK